MPLKNYDDIVHKEFGKLRIISVDNYIEKGKRRQCEVFCLICKKPKRMQLNKVLEGKYKSCGCSTMTSTKINKTNYDKLVGTYLNNYYIVKHDNLNRKLLVKCTNCHKTKEVDRYKFAHSQYGKCECLRHHNMSGTSIYHRWKTIKNRCLNPNSKDYPLYGGRGITIYKEWANNFQKFYDYIGDPPTSAHQIDRINNDKGYEPDNIRWVLSLENNNNRRDKTSNKNGYPNVTFKHGKYTSKFQYNNKSYHVGTFETAKEAYEKCAYEKKKLINKINDIV